MDAYGHHVNVCVHHSKVARADAVEKCFVRFCEEAGTAHVRLRPIIGGVGAADVSAKGWGAGGDQILVIELAATAARAEHAGGQRDCRGSD